MPAAFDEIKSVPQPLSGDCHRLPSSPIPLGADKVLMVVANEIGIASKKAKRWVGISLQAAAARRGQPGVTTLVMHPALWASLNFNHELVLLFGAAEKQGLITICDGYAYPTQQLVDILMQRAC